MPVPLLRPVPTSSACSPLVFQHAHVSRGCMGARARSRTQWRATDRRGCGVPTELRVRTTVPRTHHSVPHSCLAFSCDRLPGGPRILQSIRPIDRSIPQPLSSLRLFSSPAIVRGVCWSRRVKDENSKITAIARSGVRDEGKIEGKSDRREKSGRGEGARSA